MSDLYALGDLPSAPQLPSQPLNGPWTPTPDLPSHGSVMTHPLIAPTSHGSVMALVGNKTDLWEKREVSEEEGQVRKDRGSGSWVVSNVSFEDVDQSSHPTHLTRSCHSKKVDKDLTHQWLTCSCSLLKSFITSLLPITRIHTYLPHLFIPLC